MLNVLIFSNFEGMGWGLDSRARLENDGERKRREKEGLDSRGGPENDGGEEMRDMLAGLPVRHSHRRWESRLVFSAGFPPDGWEGREGLDSRGGPENDGGERRRGNWPSPSSSVILASRRESRLVFPTEELDSRARLENDGGEGAGFPCV